MTNRFDPPTNLKGDTHADEGKNPLDGSALRESLSVANRSFLKPEPAAPPPVAINPIIQGLFLLFLFTIPFEYLDIGIPITPSKLTGYLFILSTMLQPPLCFRRPPAPFWWFFGYYTLFIAHGSLLDIDFVEDFLGQLFSAVQLLTLFWVCSNLFRTEAVLRRGLLAISIACTLVALLQIAGVGVTVEKSWNQTERLSTFGINTNEQAKLLCFGLLCMLGLSYGWSRSAIRPRWLVWPIFCLLALAITQTGSRGALVALLPAVLVLLFGAGDANYRRHHWMRNVFLSGLGLIVLAIFSLATEAMRLRWEMTLYQGHTAHRDTLATQALAMWSEKPVFGWGPARSREEFSTRNPDRLTDTHNLFLWLLIESGLVGTIIFSIGLVLCVKNAWQARNGPHGFFPVALLVYLLIANLSGSWHYRKHFWIILAYTSMTPVVSSVRTLRNGKARPPQPAPVQGAPS